MTAKLVKQIQEINRSNHESAMPAALHVGNVAAPKEVQQLIGEVRARAERVARKFAQELQSLARAQAPRRAPEAALDETQRIGLDPASSARSIAAVHTTDTVSRTQEDALPSALTRVEEKLTALGAQLDAARTTERIQTHAFFERNLEHVASEITRAFADGFAEMKTGADAFIETKAKVAELHDALTSREPAQPVDMPGDLVEILRGVRKDLSLLVHTLNNHLEETAKIQLEVGNVRQLLLSLQTEIAEGPGAPASAEIR